MPEIIKIKTQDIKAGAAGDGGLSIELAVPNPMAPLDPNTPPLLRVGAEVGANRSFALGSGASVRLGLEAGTRCSLTPIWPSTADRQAQLAPFELSEFPDQHPDRVLLLFQVGARAGAEAGAKARYGLLAASATLRAGVEAGYLMVRAAPADTPAGQLVRDFFAALRMPADVVVPLGPGEAIAFEYGGFLNFKAGLNFGYEMSGAPAFSIGELALSQKLEFALGAKVDVGAKLVGNFRILVREGSEAGWARVTIRKSASRSLSIGATVDASAKIQTSGWPANANELLAGILGLQSRSWLNLFDRIADFAKFEDLDAYVDNLARAFVGRATGVAFEQLKDRTKFDELLAQAHAVTNAYREAGNHAVALFDKYFDPVQKTVDARLAQALRKIEQATTWQGLKAQVQVDAGGILWSALQQLTDGDPFGWMAGAQAPQSLEELRARAKKGLDLIESQAHEQLRRLIALAKTEFPLDRFLTQLDDVTDFDKLQAKANETLTAFVERVMGKAIGAVATPEAREAVVKFHQTLASLQKFRDTAFAKATQALNQSFQFRLQAEYARMKENDTLFDFEFDLGTEGGRKLMREAGLGNFENVLASFDREFVVLREGRILSRATRETRLRVNILGWNRKWQFEGLDRLITQADQRIQSDGAGVLTAITTLDLQAERDRKRQGERVYTNLLLRFIGESQGQLDFDSDNKMFLIDAIRNMSASYKLMLDDTETKPDELRRYLGFAAEFGLAASGEEAFDRFRPLLPVDGNGNFGRVSLTYDVRFSEKSLQSLFDPRFYEGQEFKPEVAAALRRSMRLLVLTNYLRQGINFEEIAWAYWTAGVYELRNRPDFMNPTSAREIKPIQQSPVGFRAAPASVTLQPEQLRVLRRLYGIEDALLRGMARLAALLRRTEKIPPKEFEQALGDFGAALQEFDKLDKGDNTLFALFDYLIRKAGGEGRDSSLTLTAKVGEQEIVEALIA